MPSDGHVDAMTYQIAIGLIDEDGKDPDWVKMVVKAKGFGDIDLAAARRWLAANPDARCRCPMCRPTPAPTPAAVQLTLI